MVDHKVENSQDQQKLSPRSTKNSRRGREFDHHDRITSRNISKAIFYLHRQINFVHAKDLEFKINLNQKTF